MFGQTPQPPNQGVPGSSLRPTNKRQRPNRVSDSTGLQGVPPNPQVPLAPSSSSIVVTPERPTQTASALVHHPPPPRSQRMSVALTQRKGRGMNKGDPLVTNDANKIEIDVDFKNGCFEDNDRIMRTIGVHVKLELEGPYANWTMAPESQKRRYWKAFMSTYRWSAENDGIIRNLWVKAITRSMNSTFSRMHTAWEKYAEIPEWMCEEIWGGFIVYWETDCFKKRSKAGQQNRAKGPNTTHTTGSVGRVTFGKQLAKATGRTEVPQDELYMSTRVHRPKKSLLVDTSAPLTWVNDTSKEDYEKYVQHCKEQHGEDRSTWPSFDPQGWLKATGPPKKGRVRGLPSLADPEVYDIPVPRRSTYFRGESSHNAGMRATYEAREKEHAEERKMMEDKIKKLEEHVNPQYMQEQFERMFAEKVDRIREEEQMKQHEAFKNYLGDYTVDTSAITEQLNNNRDEGDFNDEGNAEEYDL